MPLKGTTTINDNVQGKVSVKNEVLDDMIILRSDKTPTYMLSSVVDDKEMGVTHIIRGDDHFNNAFRQIQIINFLNWDKPLYAHIPLIHGTDGSKLSKRHGATNLIDYHNMGYTSEAMFSYLLQLGWTSRDDDYEFNKAVNLFALENINKSPAKFDVKKLSRITSTKKARTSTFGIYLGLRNPRKSVPKATLNEACFATLWKSPQTRRKLTGVIAFGLPIWLRI